MLRALRPSTNSDRVHSEKVNDGQSRSVYSLLILLLPVYLSEFRNCGQEALDEVGIKTMAEAITVVSFEDKAAQTRLGRLSANETVLPSVWALNATRHFVLKEHLFQDEGYLRSLWKQHLDGCSKT